MKLALCLQSCGRHDETAKTLQTFHRHNGFQLHAPFPVFRIHVEDGSVDERNEALAQEYGYRTIKTNKRMGNTHTRKYLINWAHKLGATHMFLLENDWECAREVPWDLIAHVFSRTDHDIYHLRLWHYFKHRSKFKKWDGESKLEFRGHAGRNRANPGWTPAVGGPEPFDIGDIHWGAPPSVTRMKELMWLHDGVSTEHESILRSGEITARCAQVKTNVFWHIGDERTPGFIR